MKEESSSIEGESFRVENRSDQILIYGYIRMAPAILFVTGLVLLPFLDSYLKALPSGLAIAIVSIVFLGPFVLDRLILPNPVDFIVFGRQVIIKFLAGQKTFGTDRLNEIEIREFVRHEYDDGKSAVNQFWLTLHIRGRVVGPLLAAETHRRAICQWAAEHEIAVRIT